MPQPFIISLLREGKKTALLAVPLVIGQVSQMLMMIADTVMIGDVGVTELAALTFASAFFTVPFVFGIGLITSISVMTSNAAGQGDDAQARSVCRNGFYLALGAGALLALCAATFIPFLSLFGQPVKVTEMAPPYLLLILVSLVPALGSMALKNHADSLDRPWPAFSIFLAGVLLNIALNQLFIFDLGYGLEGAGWATLISRIAIMLGMLAWLKYARSITQLTPNHWFAAPEPAIFRKLFALGIPASFHLIAEVGAFSAAGFLVGHYGEVSLGAHQVALNTAGILFMIPLGIAIALTIRMSKAAGSNERDRFPAIIASGWGLGFIFIIFTSSACFIWPQEIATLYVDNPEIIKMASKFLLVVAVLQLFDGFQVISGGILRGVEDVTVPAWAAWISYIGLSIPVGFLIARGGAGPIGIWWGLAIGLAVAAVFLSHRVIQRTIIRS